MMLHLDNALARVLGIALLVGGLAFPAALADPDTVVTDPECESGDQPMAASRPVLPSTLAAGCEAKAYGEGSVAIGDKATVGTVRVTVETIPVNSEAEGTLKVTFESGMSESMNVIATTDANGNVTYTPKAQADVNNYGGDLAIGDLIQRRWGQNATDPVASHQLDILPGITAVAQGTLRVPGCKNPVNGSCTLQVTAYTTTDPTTGADVVRYSTNDGMTDYDREPIGTVIRGWQGLMDSDAVPEHHLKIKAAPKAMVVTTKTPHAVAEGVAIGSSATVKGNYGVAIGRGAQVGRDHYDDPMYTEGNSANGIAIGTDSSVYGESGIAIGKDAEVDGTNGIAIGWGAKAGQNEIVIGNAHHTKATIAGVDIVRHGQICDPLGIPCSPSSVSINGINLNQARADISANSLAVFDNATAISANSSAISGFSERLLEVDDRVKQVAAMAAALSAVPNVVPGDSDGNFYVGMGFGHYDGEQGMAIGVSGRLGAKRNILVNAGAAQSGGETSARLGFGLIW